MRLEASKVQGQLDEAVQILGLELDNLLQREKSKIRTEMRAVSLKDLRRLADFIKDKCRVYGWIDPRSKETVGDAKEVNLYQLVFNFIGPVTAPVGHEVVDDSVQIGPDEEVPGGEALWLEHKGRRRLRYVRGVPPGPKANTPDKYVRTFSGSFAELLWNEERAAEWFVSHFWGEPVVDFVTCLNAHDYRYNLDGGGLYWVCAHANSQTHIGEELGTQGPLCSPFFRALDLAKGAVLVVDSASEVTRRMWCGFENVIIARERKEFVMATAQEGTGHTLTSTPAPADGGRRSIFGGHMAPEEVCLIRSSEFPRDGLMAALDTHLELARASNKDDEQMIIDTVRTELGGFDRANSKLRVLGATALFATETVTAESVQVLNRSTEPFELNGTWESAAAGLKLGLEFQNCDGLLLVSGQQVPDAESLARDLGRELLSAQHLRKVHFALGRSNVQDAGFQALGAAFSNKSALTSVTLDCRFCELGDAGMAGLVQGLGQAPNLASVHLNLRFCEKIGDAGMTSLGQGLGQAPCLASVHLDLSKCENIGDAGLKGFGQGLGQAPSLASVHLIAEGCENIGDAGVKGFGQGLGQAPSLASVHLIAEGCENIGDAGVKGFGQGLGQAPSLSSVYLDFRKCENIGDDGVKGLGQGLGQAPSLASVHLDFTCFTPYSDARSSVGDDGVAGLGQGLGQAPCLASVHLNFEWNDIIGDDGVKGLGQGLGQAPNLAAVYLNCRLCVNIGADGVKGLGQGLGQAPSLASVHLEFFGCGHLGADALTILGQALGQAPNLASVHLNLKMCSDLGHEGVQGLGQGLAQAPSLASVHLELDSFEIGADGIEGLGQALGQAPSLASVYLKWNGVEIKAETRHEVLRQLLPGDGSA